VNAVLEGSDGLLDSVQRRNMETIDHNDKPPGSPLTNPQTWKRGLVMLAFMVAFGIGQSILFLVTAIQFVWLLFKQEPNRPLVEFGKSLAVWLYDAAGFLVCATEQKPFPCQGWPRAE
jgi:sterol desaturase/sphingolipid hydroxylase (fatty acid hydroxylase superfamily)